MNVVSIREVAPEGSKERPREPQRQLGMSELKLKETWALDKLYSGHTLLTRVPTPVIHRVH